MRSVLLLCLVSLITGCSIKQQVTPVDFAANPAALICVIPADGVRESFTEAYGNALKSKGFTVQVLPSVSNPQNCPLSSTLLGRWSWDMAMYLSEVEIKVYQNGREVGSATYNSRRGSFRMDKFISAENKLKELTDQLFPVGVRPLSAQR
ncbi:Sbal_3080 family lipoprotein [Pseudomonas asplenii]|uniref:Sbal_3080 family lipoprotein n=1 Tax=Pseudomonas asplenii TaxID=53407 RepID=UPI0022342115|nr:Sbal_3080 family lipoprotein [Pseudomonas asplenii]UZE26821.1 Sbal_3080 family lipoprotein [Pseudomonas asplenii]